MKNNSVVWITGLSGAGKSTLAREIQRKLQADGLPAILLDGDDVRSAFNDKACGHDRQNRLNNAYRICRLARMLALQNFTVVVATMSLFHEIHAWNRLHLPGYFEVYLKTDLETLRRRDPKGLYQRHGSGLESNLVGLDIDVEEPGSPHLLVVNDKELEDVSEVAEEILVAFEQSEVGRKSVSARLRSE